MSSTSFYAPFCPQGLYRTLVSVRFCVTDDPEQYVKQEVSEIGEHGRVAKATRLITERASTRIGKMACEIALQRPRKVRTLVRRFIDTTHNISTLPVIVSRPPFHVVFGFLF